MIPGFTKAALTTSGFLLIVGLLQSRAIHLPTAILLYLMPIILAATRWGRGAAIVAVLVAVLGHNVLFVDPIGTLTVNRFEDALDLGLLLFTALVTAQLAHSARRGEAAERAAAVARQSDQLKTAILRAVSHDLRTPLASIKASVSSLRQPEADYSAGDRAELLAEIEEEADRLNRLVGNLIDASRLEAGALRPRVGPQDVGELIEATLRRLGSRLDGRHVVVSVAEDLPPAACDYAHAGQVLENLLDNAISHTPASSPISVRARQVGYDLRIEVADEGAGIPIGQVERIFEPFERGSTRASGSGLGLTIARGLAEANGGQLWLAPTDRGACFVLSLPVWVAQ
jgi:two-component system sensor histidine kinase KdpD